MSRGLKSRVGFCPTVNRINYRLYFMRNQIRILALRLSPGYRRAISDIGNLAHRTAAFLPLVKRLNMLP